MTTPHLPSVINIKRIQGDTFPEVFTVVVMPLDTTAAVLTVEGLTPSNAVVDLPTQTLTFPIGSPIADAVVGPYDFKVVMTAGGTTRTLVQGKWTIVLSTV